MATPATESFDCVVIGAGFFGLAAAKQYLALHPSSSLAIIDEQTSPGGTWADTRLYPGLKTNNLLGNYEYPDFPMATPEFAVFGAKKGSYIPGPAVNAYLKAYSRKFGLVERMRLGIRVVTAEHRDGDAEGGWDLRLRRVVDVPGDAGRGRPEKVDGESVVYARRLIVATGLTSKPIVQSFNGQETFGGRVFHGKDFQQNSDTIRTAKSAVVYGGSKFAWDAVYAYASAGVKVDWVIRPNGKGPCWMCPSYVTPIKTWIEPLANTRALTWFSPCIWSDADGYQSVRNFLHGTAAGRAAVNTFWSVLGSDVNTANDYDSHPEMRKLKPFIQEAMFVGPSLSILNYDTPFFDLIRGPKGKEPSKDAVETLVRVHHADITHLSPGTVHLSGTDAPATIPANVIAAHGGWSHVPSVQFLPAGIEGDLDIPYARSLATSPAFQSSTSLAAENSLLARADDEILARFPRLRDQPDVHVSAKEDKLTPYMLSRFMVPASQRFLRTRDVAFVGVVSNMSTVLMAHVQSLWVAAYFADRLARDPFEGCCGGPSEKKAESALDMVRYEAVLHNRFGKWRYPADWGGRAPAWAFDSVPYLDMLLGDLGLAVHRKKGFMAEMYQAYLGEDYKGITEEWLAKYGVSDSVGVNPAKSAAVVTVKELTEEA